MGVGVFCIFNKVVALSQQLLGFHGHVLYVVSHLKGLGWTKGLVMIPV